MKAALIVIAVCEVVRAIQNMIPIILNIKDYKAKNRLYEDFIRSLKKSDREFVRDMLEEYERQEAERENYK